MYKGEEFAKEELLRYANLYEVVQSLISTVESMDNRINEILPKEYFLIFFHIGH